MGKTLPVLLFALLIMCFAGSCRYHRVDVHKNGHVKHMKSRKTSPWFSPKGSGYSKYTNRKLKHWDRGFHK